MEHPATLTAALEFWASANGFPVGTGAQLVAACPWLGGNETVSAELAAELFEGALPGRPFTEIELYSLCSAYNAFVERDYLASVQMRAQAYEAMRQALLRYGEGIDEPFWIHEDSLSSEAPCIFVRQPRLLTEELAQQVARAASCCPHFVAINYSLDENGTQVRSVAVPRHDA